MCMFSGPVAHVSGTKIFARFKATASNRASQYLVYSMSLHSDTAVAMLLPLAVGSHAEDAVTFIALDGYPKFFEDMEKGFPQVYPQPDWSGVWPASGPAPSLLEVHEVGDFIASFVPTLADFDRLDPRFRLPASTWDQLPQYQDWGFAVFQLQATLGHSATGKAKANSIHPMAFLFPTRMPEALYFPTLHIHDGK